MIWALEEFEMLAEARGTQVEPDHGLTGRTPYDIHTDLPKTPATLCLDEVSHFHHVEAYGFRRGHIHLCGVPHPLVRALVSRELSSDAGDLKPFGISPVDRGQWVAIGRATHWASRVVLMDEPTEALGVAETTCVEQTIQRLRERGLAVLIASYNLDQVFRLADRISVLRRGTQVAVERTGEATGDQTVSMITVLH